MGVGLEDDGGVGLDGLSEGREGPEQYEGPTDEMVGRGVNTEQKRRRKSSTYFLERSWNRTDVDTSCVLWEQIQKTFVSPEQALEFLKESKQEGTFRVVRVASACYDVKLVTPEPVIKISKVRERKA